MTIVKLPFNAEVYNNVDESVLAEHNAGIFDGYIDDLGGINKRPGLREQSNLAPAVYAPISGAFWWQHEEVLLLEANGWIYKYTDLVNGGTQINGSNRMLPSTTQRCTFATDGTYVWTAKGGEIVVSKADGSYSITIDSDAPEASHVAYLDGYILANVLGTNRFQFVGPVDRFSWSALDYASAAGDADIITALHVKDRQIFLFGPASIEVWENDGVSPFKRVPGGFIQSGLIAPYSVVVRDDGLYWLDHKRHFVRWNGSSPERISSPFDKLIATFVDVRDCQADSFEVGGYDFIDWTFPAANRTFLYNVNNKTWTEWSTYDSQSGQRNRWRANTFMFCPMWGEVVVGLTYEGDFPEVCTLDSDWYWDLMDNIRLEIKTGHLDHGGGSVRKISNKLSLRAKQGAASSDYRVTEGNLCLRWRDDGKQHWSRERHLPLGTVGNTGLTLQKIGCGSYYQRQWELTCTDPVPVVISNVEETIEVVE